MAILSNKGRVIESLANYASPSSGDLLVIQDVKNNQTKNITLTQLSQKLATVIQDVTVDFTSENNKFTGSFKGGTFTGSSADFATSLRLIGGKAFIDKNNFQALSFTNMKFGTTGAPIEFLSTIFTDQDIEANIITANSDVVVGGVVYGALEGSVHGNLTGDVYSDAGNKVLENSANLAKNALFYGTASYAKTASVASYAKVAEVTLTCVTHATDADFATYGLSSSYASQSRSSSYLRYHPILNPKNGTASYAIKSNASDYATTANTATSTTFLTYTGTYNGSASYAISSSYILSSSYAFSASYVRSSSYSRSGSYARSSSYARSARSSSYARSASYARTASYASQAQVATKTSSTFIFPAAGGVVTQYQHLLGTVPKFYRWVAVLNVADPVNALYDVGDEVDLCSFFNGNGFSDDDTVPAFVVYADLYFTYAARNTFATLYLPSPDGTNVDKTITTTSWRLKCYVLG